MSKTSTNVSPSVHEWSCWRHEHIKNMTCGGCARSVTKAIQSVDAEAKVTIDPNTRKVDVASQRPHADFEAALQRVGYPAAAA